MSILVAYASKYGATQEIAERIADKLRSAGQRVDARPVKNAGDLEGYDAFVIGSAVYFGHWMKEATEFVRRNRSVLVDRPVWLFSSGPLGTEARDQQGRDLREVAEPGEIAEFRQAINPRDHRVFFGVMNRGKLSFGHRLLASLPASRESWAVDGDFRDWEEIESWAGGIARELAPGKRAKAGHG